LKTQESEQAKEKYLLHKWDTQEAIEDMLWHLEITWYYLFCLK
jgi:hypothetical protein